DLLRAEQPTGGKEPLATLGDSLALFRLSTSARGFTGTTFDVGAYTREIIALTEADVQGRRRWAEIFAVDHLGDAIVRLYERYAELLPEGPARARAAATARSVAMRVGPVDLDRFAEAFAPDIEVVDHRVLGTWSAHGAEAVLQTLRSLVDLSHGVVVHYDDILALRSDALLVRVTVVGTACAGGGAYERLYLGLLAWGADGLVTRWEHFDVDRDAEALARFDELAAGPGAGRPVQRRGRGNPAATNGSRFG